MTCQAATKILARQLVRLRQQIVNLQGSRAQIRGVATHTQVKSFLQITIVYDQAIENFWWILYMASFLFCRHCMLAPLCLLE